MIGLTTVRADGIDWPLATFVDAYGMKVVDPFDLPSFSAPHAMRLVTLTRDGQVLPPQYANEVVWARTVAFSPLPGTPEGVPCRLCGDPALRVEDDLCDDCEADQEPWGW